jgi:hypothetical protein
LTEFEGRSGIFRHKHGFYGNGGWRELANDLTDPVENRAQSLGELGLLGADAAAGDVMRSSVRNFEHPVAG